MYIQLTFLGLKLVIVTWIRKFICYMYAGSDSHALSVTQRIPVLFIGLRDICATESDVTVR